jgi:hypothetical protein
MLAVRGRSIEIGEIRMRPGLKNLAPVACAVGGDSVGASGVTVNDV